MNERIKQLANKAFDQTDADDQQWFLSYSEKLTALVVKECAGIYSKIDNGNLHLGTEDFLEALHKHFGDQ